MNHEPDMAFRVLVSLLYPAWSLLWAVLWTKVAYHYSYAASVTWSESNATWKTMCRDLFDPLVFAVRDYFCQWAWGRRIFGLECDDFSTKLVPTTSPGNILRFSIFVGSLTPIVFGWLFVFSTDWSAAGWKLILGLVFIFTSILGALGHLFLAHRANRRRWSQIVTYTFAWLAIGPMVFLTWRSIF